MGIPQSDVRVPTQTTTAGRFPVEVPQGDVTEELVEISSTVLYQGGLPPVSQQRQRFAPPVATFVCRTRALLGTFSDNERQHRYSMILSAQWVSCTAHLRTPKKLTYALACTELYRVTKYKIYFFEIIFRKVQIQEFSSYRCTVVYYEDRGRSSPTGVLP